MKGAITNNVGKRVSAVRAPNSASSSEVIPGTLSSYGSVCYLPSAETPILCIGGYQNFRVLMWFPLTMNIPPRNRRSETRSKRSLCAGLVGYQSSRGRSRQPRLSQSIPPLPPSPQRRLPPTITFIFILIQLETPFLYWGQSKLPYAREALIDQMYPIQCPQIRDMSERIDLCHESSAMFGEEVANSTCSALVINPAAAS